MNKSGQVTYRNEDKDSLVVASDDIEGFHCQPINCRGVSQNLQNVVNAVNSRCDDWKIKYKSSMRYFREAIVRANKNEDDHKD